MKPSPLSNSTLFDSAPHLVLATWGSWGDVFPYLAIAQEWQRRGGRATMATCEMYREVIENIGIGFRAIRPDLPDTASNPEFYHRVLDPVRGGARFLLRETWGQNARAAYDDLFAATHDADIMLSHSMCVVAPLVAAKRLVIKRATSKGAIPNQAREMRWVSAIVSPMFLQSATEAPSLPFVPQLADVPTIGKMASRGWNSWLQNWLREPLQEIESLRWELKLPRGVHPLFADAHSPSRSLALWSQSFVAPQPDWPNQTRVVGFCHFDGASDETSSTRCEAFLRQGDSYENDAPVLFTLGASSALDAGDFWRESLGAVQLLKCRAIFVVGQNENQWPSELKNLPPNVLTLPFLPLSSVLSRCCAIVHHGGIGTLALALRAGVPQLVMPHSQDQPDNAWRARKIGVARLLSRRNYRAPRVVAELQHLLHAPQITNRVLEVQKIVAQENGAATACDWIERELQM